MHTILSIGASTRTYSLCLSPNAKWFHWLRGAGGTSPQDEGVTRIDGKITATSPYQDGDSTVGRWDKDSLVWMSLIRRTDTSGGDLISHRSFRAKTKRTFKLASKEFNDLYVEFLGRTNNGQGLFSGIDTIHNVRTTLHIFSTDIERDHAPMYHSTLPMPSGFQIQEAILSHQGSFLICLIGKVQNTKQGRRVTYEIWQYDLQLTYPKRLYRTTTTNRYLGHLALTPSDRLVSFTHEYKLYTVPTLP